MRWPVIISERRWGHSLAEVLSLHYRGPCYTAVKFTTCEAVSFWYFSKWALIYFYRITMCANIATAVLILSPSVPPLFHALLTTPNSALTCMMACKVYRDVKFGSHTDIPDLSFPTKRLTQESSSPPDRPAIRVEKQTFIDAFSSRKEVSLIQNLHESFLPSQTSSNSYSEAWCASSRSLFRHTHAYFCSEAKFCKCICRVTYILEEMIN